MLNIKLKGYVMKKLLLGMFILSGMAVSANTQQEPQDIKPEWIGSVGGCNDEVLSFFYEPKDGGNILLEKCDDKHYDCDKIRRILEENNKISTPKQDMAKKAHLAVKFIFKPNDYKVKRKNR